MPSDPHLLSPADVERLAGEAGLSIPDVCKRAGIHHTTFYRWRAGKTEPTLTVYRRIRDAIRARKHDAGGNDVHPSTKSPPQKR